MVETIKRIPRIAVLSLIFGCLFLIPFLGFIFSIVAIILGITALVTISNNKDKLKGNGVAISGIVLGGVGVIIIPLIAILAAIVIPNFFRGKIIAHERNATMAVDTISAAMESYAVENGRYPESADEIVSEEARSLIETYNNKTVDGYEYSLELGGGAYKITAKPQECGVTGAKVIVVETEGKRHEWFCK